MYTRQEEHDSIKIISEKVWLINMASLKFEILRWKQNVMAQHSQ